ncbi:MAG: hypothetical protein ACFFAO_07915 [Candidatus Hermodarchaeota archaeon]
MIVILSYFHVRIGPLIFFSCPKNPQLDREISARIYEIMNQPDREEFFTQSFENLKLLNYYFQIPSNWARGGTELCMLTMLINQQISPEIEMIIKSSCKKFSEKMQSNEEIFTGFYINDLDEYDDDKVRIKKNELLIKEWVEDLYRETLKDMRKKYEEQKITELFNELDIFESLGMMSKELQKISKEISSSESSLKENTTIKNSLSNLNKIIDDLYEGYMEKMAEIDIEIETDFFSSTEDESETDTQKSKKELKKVLEGELNEDKE